MKTINVDAETARRLERFAATKSKSPEEVANRVLRSYLDWEEELIQAVEEGLAQADRGEFVPDDEMEKLFTRYKPVEVVHIAG